jgi:hypothetical protein
MRKCTIMLCYSLHQYFSTGRTDPTDGACRIATSPKLRLLYKPGYVIPCVGNLTEGKFRGSMFEFPTDA